MPIFLCELVALIVAACQIKRSRFSRISSMWINRANSDKIFAYFSLFFSMTFYFFKYIMLKWEKMIFGCDSLRSLAEKDV